MFETYFDSMGNSDNKIVVAPKKVPKGREAVSYQANFEQATLGAQRKCELQLLQYALTENTEITSKKKWADASLAYKHQLQAVAGWYAMRGGRLAHESNQKLLAMVNFYLNYTPDEEEEGGSRKRKTRRWPNQVMQ